MTSGLIFRDGEKRVYLLSRVRVAAISVGYLDISNTVCRVRDKGRL